MEINPNEGIGKIKLGMTPGEVVDHSDESQLTVKYGGQVIDSLKYTYSFSKERRLRYIVIKQKADDSIMGIKVGSSVSQAVKILGCHPRYDRDESCLTFDNLANVYFYLGNKYSTELYEQGAYEDDDISQFKSEYSKMKITSIGFGS